MSEGVRRVIGIDPGLAATGYGIIEGDTRRAEVIAYGAIRTRPRWTRAERLHHIHEQVGALIEEHRPHELAIEEPYVAKNARSALAIGEARAAVQIAAAGHATPVFEYPPATIKASVAGHGAASKEQVQAMVTLQLGLAEAPTPLDAADALAIALTRLAEVDFEARLAGSGSTP
ncbi:MAG: crossover junction endodeoxyribonuclease RuvC [Chloroflexi bacterium]|nr:crossover junction endodeoxyribonuclease RuvC [Chloroflexota bacterium]